MQLRKPYKSESARNTIKSHQLSRTNEEPLSLFSAHSRTPRPDGYHEKLEAVAAGLGAGTARGRKFCLINLNTPPDPNHRCPSRPGGDRTRGRWNESELFPKEDYLRVKLSLYFLIKFFFPAYLFTQTNDPVGKASHDGHRDYPVKQSQLS